MCVCVCVYIHISHVANASRNANTTSITYKVVFILVIKFPPRLLTKPTMIFPCRYLRLKYTPINCHEIVNFAHRAF